MFANLNLVFSPAYLDWLYAKRCHVVAPVWHVDTERKLTLEQRECLCVVLFSKPGRETSVLLSWFEKSKYNTFLTVLYGPVILSQLY